MKWFDAAQPPTVTVPVEATVTQTNKSGTGAGKTETVVLDESVPVGAVQVPVGSIAEVGVDLGLTLNLGNWESARIGVSLKYPSDPAKVDAAYAFAKQWATAKLETLVAEVRTEAAVRKAKK